ncbi:MAG: hypothetical protein AAGJ87_04625 [Pseudomonadota bacterium]
MENADYQSQAEKVRQAELRGMDGVLVRSIAISGLSMAALIILFAA